MGKVSKFKFNKLKFLEIKGQDISTEIFDFILSNTTQLESLYLNSKKFNLIKPSIIICPRLKKIKYAKIEYPENLNEKQISFLNAQPALEQLISPDHELFQTETLKTSIKWVGTTGFIRNNNLFQFINFVPSKYSYVENLEIDNKEITEKIIMLPETSFPRLKTISFNSFESVDLPLLKNILQKWPRIKIELCFSEQDKQHFLGEITETSFLNSLIFDKIKCSNPAWTGEMLYKALQSQRNIFTLRISSMQGIMPTNTPLSLKNIHLLNFNGSSLDPDQILSIVFHCPSLKSIVLPPAFNNNFEAINLLTIYCKNLRKITLNLAQQNPEVLAFIEKLQTTFSLIHIDYSLQAGLKSDFLPPPQKDSIYFGSAGLDLKTSHDNPELPTRKIFSSKPDRMIHPANYRLNVYTRLALGKKTREVNEPRFISFIQKIPACSEIKSLYDKNYAKTPNIFYGKIIIPAALQFDWIELPSLTSNDKIVKFHRLYHSNLDIVKKKIFITLSR